MRYLKKILFPAITGTTMMTAFSYVVSMVEEENFSEPEHLGTLINRITPHTSKETSQITGWVGHYVVGVLLVSIYHHLWKTGKIKKTVRNGVILGILSGAIGAVVWRKTLESHPFPPHINLTKYFLQLVPAHIVFAICATLTSAFLDQNQNDKNTIEQKRF